MRRIFLIGYMGAGKTTFGRQLAFNLGLSFIDTDVYIENKYHKTVSSLFAEKGESKFRILERKILEEISKFEDVVIATGGGMPCFYDNIDYMNNNGITIFLQVPDSELAKRLSLAKFNRPLLIDKNYDEIFSYVSSMLTKRLPFYQKAKYTVDASNNKVVDKMAQICAQMD
ncbi:MAG: shikimate kinase [Bacteroidia bacterium]|nr:shikimate kinase [Bacteroidia bacterium]